MIILSVVIFLAEPILIDVRKAGFVEPNRYKALEKLQAIILS
jgi:hypothetical protein